LESRGILENMWTPLLDSLRSQTELTGFWAGSLTTIAFAPQLVKAWKNGGQGLSWAMLALFGTGVWLWFLYGLLRMSGPIMLANAVTGVQVLVILAIKIRHAYVSRRSTSSDLANSLPAPDKSVAS
jgi:MtN3 and saliva related transmembrane protein